MIFLPLKHPFKKMTVNKHREVIGNTLQRNAHTLRRAAVHIVNNRFYEIGRPESLNEFKEYIKHRFYEAHPAVFLDRDGVINEIVFNEDTEQLDSPMNVSEFRYLPFVEEALDMIGRKGYYIFVVTNQPAAAKGKTTLEKLYDINTSFIYEIYFI